MPWYTTTDFLTPSFQLFRTIVQGRHYLSFTPPQGMTGFQVARYLQSQGVSCDAIGMVDGSGECTVTVDDPDKALAALNRLHGR